MYSNGHTVAFNHLRSSAKKARSDFGAVIDIDSLGFTELNRALAGFIGQYINGLEILIERTSPSTILQQLPHLIQPT
jgi:hypothetical protein